MSPSASLTPSPTKVLMAGVLNLILTMGIARFAYTPLLPIMQQQTWLNDVSGGWLATINYMGYMTGALIASSLGDLDFKDRLYRAGILVALVSTAGMALSENFYVWSFFRYIAGLSSAAGLLLGSGLILNWLLRHGHKSELGLHFSGAGLGITFVSIVVWWADLHLTWAQQWWLLTLLGVGLAIPAWCWLPSPTKSAGSAGLQNLVDSPPTRIFMWLMLAIYFCAGFGYVVSATFIVAIVDRIPALSGQGDLTFAVIGISAAPACLIWDIVCRKIGELPSLLIAFIMQIIGILLPAVHHSLPTILLSSVLFGVTFIGIVSLVLTMAGRFYPTKPAKLMGKMTLSYGVAQIFAPALVGYLAETSGNYFAGLYIAAAVMCVGAVLLCVLIFISSDEREKY